VWTDDGGNDVGPTFQWWWNDASLAAHINAKELSCLLHALTKYKLRDVTLKWVTDNKVAFDIMRSQYCRSPRLLQILKPIVDYCSEHNVFVDPFWISTLLQLADAPSRDVPLSAPKLDLIVPTHTTTL
jgi:hypothetical protein